jgi:hypothetical protein
LDVRVINNVFGGFTMSAEPYCERYCPFVEQQIRELREGDDRMLERVCPYVAAVAIANIGANLVPVNLDHGTTTHQRANNVLFRKNVKLKSERYHELAMSCAASQVARMPAKDPEVGLATVTASNIYDDLLQSDPNNN